MKFLVDRCAGRRLSEWLRQQSHDVVESRERGPDPGDRVLLGWAAAEGRILITMDKDFGELILPKSNRTVGSSGCLTFLRRGVLRSWARCLPIMPLISLEELS